MSQKLRSRANSILDVAREAKVSPSTVSLVINRNPRVSREMRQRVESVIRRMDYTPRSARRKKRHVAVLYTSRTIFCGELVEYCREWIAGIRDGLGEVGVDVSVFSGEEHVSKDPMFEAGLDEGDFDGLIMMGVHSWDGYLQRTLEAGVPLVAMNRLPRRTEFSAVCLDHYAAAQLAADHLVRLGHRHIGLFANRQSTYPLFTGFMDRLAERGLSPAFEVEDTEIEFDDLATFARHARRLADSGATAIFAGDPAAYRLANALEEIGLGVPERVSVMGFDNLGLVTDRGRRLSSIDYDKRAMGRLAGQMLQNLLAKKGEVANMIAHLPARIYEGQTVGPCPAG